MKLTSGIAGIAAIVLFVSNAHAVQTAAPVPPTSMAETASPTGAALWKNLTYGMSGEEAAAVLRAVEGIKRVTIKQKKNKPPQLTIEYLDGGVDIGPSKATVETVFTDAGLTEVRLRTDECASAAVAKAKTVFEALKAKLGRAATERVVDEFGQPMETTYGFWNDTTRVRAALNSHNPAVQDASAPGSGAVGALADIFGAMSANAARYACPEDGGERITMILSYTSQAAFLAEQAAYAAEKEKIRKKAADGL